MRDNSIRIFVYGIQATINRTGGSGGFYAAAWTKQRYLIHLNKNEKQKYTEIQVNWLHINKVITGAWQKKMDKTKYTYGVLRVNIMDRCFSQKDADFNWFFSQLYGDRCRRCCSFQLNNISKMSKATVLFRAIHFFSVFLETNSLCCT